MVRIVSLMLCVFWHNKKVRKKNKYKDFPGKGVHFKIERKRKILYSFCYGNGTKDGKNELNNGICICIWELGSFEENRCCIRLPLSILLTCWETKTN